jgi:hypothetical protein
MATNTDDLPFALFYLRDGESQSLTLTGCCRKLEYAGTLL